jgi:hypothetical protein
VWSNEWKLAEWVWDVGPELALQADMKYVFGRPEPPTFDFKTSDIDAKKLIQDAMPKEGPKGSGAREALQNRAEWKGALKEQRKEASKIPADLADQQAKAPQPKDAPSKPPKKTPPAGLTPAEPTKTKEELAKDLETKAAPGASKETDPTHKDRWDKGTKALADLAARAKSDPEDSEEIAKHLADIKSTYGFKTLEHRREGEQWLIDAAMSPGTKYYIDADDVEPDELMGGKTYSQLRGTEGITPDHEPQNAVMKYISSKNFTVTRNGKDTGIRPFPAGTKVSDYSHGTGICLNMNRYRHEEFSRTWGPRGAETKAEAVKEIEDEWNSMPEYADVERTRKEARKRVAKVVRGELTADHRKVRQIYEKAAKKKKVKERLDAGLEAVREANKEKYREAFED